MRLPKITWIGLGTLLAIATVAIHYEVKISLHRQHGGSVQQLGNVKVGEPAPDFSLQDLSDRPVALSSYRGQKVVVMDFWATWCGPCRMSMPGLQELQDKFKDRDLEILSVNQGEPADQVRAFIERKKYLFHVVLDSDGAVGSKYGVRAIPTLAVVDKEGVVRWLSVGNSGREDDLRRLLEQLISQPATLPVPTKTQPQ
jgi:peroxiredoxin